MYVQISTREFATVLAALRCFQRERFSQRGALIECLESDTATDAGTFEPLTAHEIDLLCERINKEHL